MAPPLESDHKQRIRETIMRTWPAIVASLPRDGTPEVMREAAEAAVLLVLARLRRQLADRPELAALTPERIASFKVPGWLADKEACARLAPLLNPMEARAMLDSARGTGEVRFSGGLDRGDGRLHRLTLEPQHWEKGWWKEKQQTLAMPAKLLFPDRPGADTEVVHVIDVRDNEADVETLRRRLEATAAAVKPEAVKPEAVEAKSASAPSREAHASPRRAPEEKLRAWLLNRYSDRPKLPPQTRMYKDANRYFRRRGYYVPQVMIRNACSGEDPLFPKHLQQRGRSAGPR
jgi:hypothetical protein